jgi:hypothetical protein
MEREEFRAACYELLYRKLYKTARKAGEELLAAVALSAWELADRLYDRQRLSRESLLEGLNEQVGICREWQVHLRTVARIGSDVDPQRAIAQETARYLSRATPKAVRQAVLTAENPALAAIEAYDQEIQAWLTVRRHVVALPE